MTPHITMYYWYDLGLGIKEARFNDYTTIRWNHERNDYEAVINTPKHDFNVYVAAIKEHEHQQLLKYREMRAAMAK